MEERLPVGGDVVGWAGNWLVGRVAGFRNVLVDQYTTVDDTIVIAALDDVDQLDDFVSQVSRWMIANS